MPKVVTTARAVRTYNHASCGHSIEAFRFFEWLGEEWVRLVLLMNPGCTVEVSKNALGGSYLSQSVLNASEIGTPIALMPVAWVDDTGALANAAQLTNVVGSLTARTGSARVKSMDWVIGYADQRAMGGNTALTPTQTVALAKAALVFAINATRVAAINGGGEAATSIPVMIGIPGRHTTGEAAFPLDAERHRNMILQVIEEGTNLFRGPELYDFDAQDSVHPARAVLGQIEVARRSAELFGKYVIGITSYTDLTSKQIFLGPTIASFTRVDDTHTDVALTLEAGDALVMPAKLPFGFRFGPASADYTQIFTTASPPPVVAPTEVVQQSSTVLRFTHPVVPVDVKGFFPYDQVGDFDYSRRIRGAVSKKPLRSWRSF